MLERLKKNLEKGLCISAITLAELEHGVKKSAYPEKNELALMQFLSVLTVLPFDDMASVEYGKICAYLWKQGAPIGVMDMLIAAHAKAEGMILVTNNVRELQRTNQNSEYRRESDRRRKSDRDPVHDQYAHGGCRSDSGPDKETRSGWL